MTQGVTRVRLIEVGGNLFYHRGFQAVGLDQILEQVGITKTAFYKHFESKDDLIVAVLEKRDRRDMEEWLSFVRRRGRDGARQQLGAFFELLDDWFSKEDFRGCFFLNALTEFPSEHDPINRAAKRHGEHLGAAIVALCREAGASDPEGLAGQLMLLMTGAIATRHRVGDLRAARTAGEVAAVLIGGACENA